jgi:hypothetical protein
MLFRRDFSSSHVSLGFFEPQEQYLDSLGCLCDHEFRDNHLHGQDWYVKGDVEGLLVYQAELT